MGDTRAGRSRNKNNAGFLVSLRTSMHLQATLQATLQAPLIKQLSGDWDWKLRERVVRNGSAIL